MSVQDQRSTAAPEPIDEKVPNEQALLKELGITARQHVSYEWSGYRYTNAVDAIVAARRAAR